MSITRTRLIFRHLLTAVALSFVCAPWLGAPFWFVADARVILKRHHSWVNNYLPTSETTQVLTLTSFLQLILALYLHIAFTGTMPITAAHAFLLAWFGVGCRAVLNIWVRGDDLDFRRALTVDQIHTSGPVEWIDEESREPALTHFDVGARVRILGKALFVNGKRRRVRWPKGFGGHGKERGRGHSGGFMFSGMAGRVVEAEERIGGLVALEGGGSFANPALPSRVYATPHEPGGLRLGDLAAEDWETKHLAYERQRGFDDFDVFDGDVDLQPEKDPSLLASFLNSNVMQIFSRRNAFSTGANAPPPVPPERQVVSVEVPGGLPKGTLRDAMLQWRMRHTAHPVEAEAIDWLLGQLDPSGFGLLHVKVPGQLRPLLTEALIAYSQRHAELHLDACHSSRLSALLRQLEHGFTAGATTRYQPMDVELPEDADGSSEAVRHLLHKALAARIQGAGGGDGGTGTGGGGGGADGAALGGTLRKASRDITQEEGYFLQSTMAVLSDAFSLVAMPYHDKAGARASAGAEDEQLEKLKDEIHHREEEMRKR